jgi:hypothetical protein
VCDWWNAIKTNFGTGFFLNLREVIYYTHINAIIKLTTTTTRFWRINDKIPTEKDQFKYTFEFGEQKISMRESI